MTGFSHAPASMTLGASPRNTVTWPARMAAMTSLFRVLRVALLSSLLYTSSARACFLRRCRSRAMDQTAGYSAVLLSGSVTVRRIVPLCVCRGVCVCVEGK